jgi:hypothetical protein
VGGDGVELNNKHMNEIVAKEKCDQAIGLKGQIEKSYIVLSALLKDIRDNRLYQPQYDKFPEFLMELEMTEGTASRMIQSYEKLVLKYAFPQEKIESIGWSKCYLVSKNAKSRGEAEELLELADTLSHKDLDITLKERYQGIDQSSCEHDWKTIRICSNCGLKEHV